MRASAKKIVSLSPTLEDIALQAETLKCLDAIRDLVHQDDIAVEALELRLQQYAECASGAYCPEVAFDPVAMRLRFLAAVLKVQQNAPRGVLWEAGVRSVLMSFLHLRKRNAGRTAMDLPLHNQPGSL